MPKATALLTNFTGGELSPLLDVRTDTQRYRNGAREIRNALVMPHGGAKKRPGSMHVFKQKSAAFSSRLVPFEFNTVQAYQIEFAASVLRFYKDKGIITGTPVNITAATKANPCVITANSHGFSNGDLVVIQSVGGMTQLNNREYTVAGATANTFQLSGINSSSFTTYTSGGTVAKPVELAHSYSSDDIDGLSFAQSADTLYIAHTDYPLQKLTRSSHTVWTLSEADIRNGPFRDLNSDVGHYMTVAVTGSASVSAATKANPCVVTTSGAHNFQEGQAVTFASVGGMTALNGNIYVVRNVTATTFELWSKAEEKIDSTGFGTYTSGGTVSTSVTDFGTISEGSLVTLTSTDALFTTNHIGALFRLWEPGQTSGVATPVAGTPFAVNKQYTFGGNIYGVAYTSVASWQTAWTPPSHERGVVRIRDVAASDYHDSAYLHDVSCVLEITARSSSTVVTARVVRNHIPKSVVDAGTSIWEEGAWSAERGYPGQITFHESRLWAAASSNEPQTVWASRVAAFEDFQDGADDDRAIIYKLASDKVDAILWVNSGKNLMFGTASAEYIAAASSQNEALTPSNVRIVRQTPYGSSPIKPLRVSNAILFGQRQGAPTNPSRKVRELTYSFEVDAFVAPDLTIISEHITGTGIVEMAYQAAPDAVAWCVRADGKVATLTYEREQEVSAWALQIFGGVDTVVERVSVIPGADGDELWLGVARTIGGGTVRTIEVLTTGLRDDLEKEDCIYLDAALTYEGASTTTITGLWHLEGETVYALVNGSKQGPFTVATGRITLSSASGGGSVHVGLRYTSVVESVDIDAAAAEGTAKSRAKRISEVWPSFYRSLGGRIGPRTERMFDLLFRTDSDIFGTSPALKTDFVRHGMPGGYNRRAPVRFEHDEPYPFTYLGIAAEISTSG